MRRLGDFLPRFLDKFGLTEKLTQQKAVLLWYKAVGPDIRRQTTANEIKQGVLFVAVSNSVWLNELVFLKPKIIKNLNDLIGQEVVKDIKFYLK